MLKEYEIEIQEVLSRVQKVEAESVGEAIDKAMALYYGQEIILDAEDMKGVDFTPITNKEGKNR
ncbi:MULTISPECIES: DpnD/PcfM family protein [Enterococcus]|nr:MULTISPECIES: DpnD/PcfM family protein [Enterococcus]MCD5019843.1 DpnD/PcfM family protein [Enterococcus faecium]MDT2357564.1 DpnD/PcfM family protein [Enterococcus faecium]OXC92707.1 DpnD protein [Enterococcus faecalis]HAQ3903754.1 DpnD protein [Enterococcus faecium]HAQ3905385.1 DpnD protein [Enterococcus faecium]